MAHDWPAASQVVKKSTGGQARSGIALLAWLVSVVGVATGAAHIPQALRIWRRRSSDDVSILTYLLFLGGQIVYFIYGIRIRQWPLIIGMAANLVGSLAVILSALRFRATAPGARE